MPRKTIALIVSLFVITIVLLVAAIRSGKPPVTQPPTTTQEAVPDYAKTTLMLTPNPVTAATNGSVDVVVDTDTNEITAVQLELKYDPAVITNIKITQGDFFAQPVILFNTQDAKTGTATFALGITPAQRPIKGKGTVATITFSKVAGTTEKETQLTLLPESLVTASGIDKSVLKSMQGTTIVFQ